MEPTMKTAGTRPRALSVAICLILLMVIPGSAESSIQGTAETDAYRPPAHCGRSTRVVAVSDGPELSTALTRAKPGDLIWLHPGTYEGTFTGSRAGTAGRHITLCGTSRAVLDGGTFDHGYTLHLAGADYTDVRGITVRRGLKGIMTDDWDHGTIDHVTVRDIGEEGIHLRASSSNDTISNSRISDTGRADPAVQPDAHHNGEGVYVGSAHSNWDRYTADQPDRSDNVRVIANTFTHTTAENLDLKEGTDGGLVRGNTFNGAGMDHEAADSWVDIKGNNYRIVHNRGFAAPEDGFQLHVLLDGWGVGNVFAGNVLHVDAHGYGFRIDADSGDNTVRCNNRVVAAESGFADTPCVAVPDRPSQSRSCRAAKPSRSPGRVLTSAG